jgi:PIN domain nuclease of toxin-antitoxin system
MIILDTHIWIWHVQGDTRLRIEHKRLIQKHETDRIGISAVSLWEVAKAVELGRLLLPVPIEDWFEIALNAPGIEIFPLTPKICIWSTQLPGDFHKDPFDQLIVATARVHDLPLVTADSNIQSYPHVKLA